MSNPQWTKEEIDSFVSGNSPKLNWHKLGKDRPMEKFKIEVGKWYKTRNGKKAHAVHCRTDSEEYPIMGYIEGDKYSEEWTKDGRWDIVSSANSKDLVEEWKEPKRGVAYVNVYANGNVGQGQDTVKQADECAKAAHAMGATKRIARIKIEWVEGQFDD